MQAAAAAATQIEELGPAMLQALMNLADGKLDDAHNGLTGGVCQRTSQRGCHMSLAMVEDAASKYDAAMEEYKESADSGLYAWGALNNLAYDLARDTALR